jgi:COP9 signalosome complex subunit 6
VKEVHKEPALDLVGWWTLMADTGPGLPQQDLHQQILSKYGEATILLGFHPTAALDGSSRGKLPLTIYEANYEADEAPDGEDKPMRDSEDTHLKLKYRELPYSIESGEAEMIGVDFVAKGSGNATAVKIKDEKPRPGKGKGKENGAEKDEEPEHILSREDEELIASLTAKANATKMLHSRIKLLTAYLEALPPSYVSGGQVDDGSSPYLSVNHTILRSIQALLTRLSLVIPANKAAFEEELMAEQNEVELVTLLNAVTQNVRVLREVGRKFSVIEAAQNQSNKKSQMNEGLHFKPSGEWDQPGRSF